MYGVSPDTNQIVHVRVIILQYKKLLTPFVAIGPQGETAMSRYSKVSYYIL